MRASLALALSLTAAAPALADDLPRRLDCALPVLACTQGGGCGPFRVTLIGDRVTLHDGWQPGPLVLPVAQRAPADATNTLKLGAPGDVEGALVFHDDGTVTLNLFSMANAVQSLTLEGPCAGRP